jgi:chromosomal replication initiator protein
MSTLTPFSQERRTVLRKNIANTTCSLLTMFSFSRRRISSRKNCSILFNYLYDNNKQIIFSSDRAPVAIPDIAERLRGRFSSGMTVDISEPDAESRVAIVRKKLAE